MTQLKIVWGSSRDYPLQAINEGGVSFPSFSANDVLTAYVYQGQNLVPLFNPTVTWFTNNGTQTGFGQGQVLVSIANAQAATLDEGGTYSLQVWWSPAVQPDKSAAIARCTLYVEPSPGTATQQIVPYCQLSDMLMYANWITIVQNADTDEEGFYSQRLQARKWMDMMILNAYRGAFVGMFEDLSVMAFDFGNVGWRRSLGPSQALFDYLAANDLLLREDVVQACAYKAISIVGMAQIGINNQFAAFGAYYRDEATRVASAITAEIDLNDDGWGEMFITLGASNTLRT